MEGETESVRQVGGWSWAQQGVRGETGNRSLVVGRCHGQETFALLHCPPWEMHEALGMSQLDGKRGEHLEREQELTFTEHLLSPQELSRPPHSQALLSCPY